MSLVKLPDGVVKERLQLLHLCLSEGHPVLKAHVALVEGLVARLLGIALLQVLLKELLCLLPPSWEDLEARVASPQVVGILLLEVATLPLFTEQTVPHTDHLLLVQEVQWQRAGVLIRDIVLLPRGIVTSGQVVAIELPGIHHTVVNDHVAVFMSPSSGQLGLLIEVHREGELAIFFIM